MKRITIALRPNMEPLSSLLGWVRWWRRKPLPPGRYTAEVAEVVVKDQDHVTLILRNVKEAK